jgi:hypothetical protein
MAHHARSSSFTSSPPDSKRHLITRHWMCEFRPDQDSRARRTRFSPVSFIQDEFRAGLGCRTFTYHQVYQTWFRERIPHIEIKVATRCMMVGRDDMTWCLWVRESKRPAESFKKGPASGDPKRLECEADMYLPIRDRLVEIHYIYRVAAR